MYVWAQLLLSASIDVGYQIDSPPTHFLDQHRSWSTQERGMERNHFDESDAAMDDVAEEMEVDEPSRKYCIYVYLHYSVFYSTFLPFL
jgi:hypothetical protein